MVTSLSHGGNDVLHGRFTVGKDRGTLPELGQLLL